MTNLQTKILTETWVTATWSEYLQVIENLDNDKAKSYYHHHKYRIEMSPLGHDHASDHTVIMLAINLFAIFKNLDFNKIKETELSRNRYFYFLIIFWEIFQKFTKTKT